MICVRILFRMCIMILFMFTYDLKMIYVRICMDLIRDLLGFVRQDIQHDSTMIFIGFDKGCGRICVRNLIKMFATIELLFYLKFKMICIRNCMDLIRILLGFDVGYLLRFSLDLNRTCCWI